MPLKDDQQEYVQRMTAKICESLQLKPDDSIEDIVNHALESPTEWEISDFSGKGFGPETFSDGFIVAYVAHVLAIITTDFWLAKSLSQQNVQQSIDKASDLLLKSKKTKKSLSFQLGNLISLVIKSHTETQQKQETL